MNTEELYRCIDFIWNWQFLTEKDHAELARKGDIFGESHIEPVLRELEDNLFLKNHEERVEIITRYVRAFNRVSIQNEFERTEGDAGKLKRINNMQFIQLKHNADNGDIHAPFIHNLYVLIFKEIQLTCRHYKIPFIKILQDQNIDLETLFFEPDEELDINNYEDNSKKNSSAHRITTKPIFKPEVIPVVYDLLKDFFSLEQQIKLNDLLKTGGISKEKLIFMDNGNRLTDTLKKLIEHDLITGCAKQDLINWVVQNFNYKGRDKISSFLPKTVNKYLSTNEYPCKSPLIEIEEGQIVKVTRAHQKKYSNY